MLMNNIALCFVGRGVTSKLDGFNHNKKRNFARELLKSATDDLCPEPYVRDEFSREWDTLMRLFHQSSDDTRSFQGPLKDQSWPLLLMKLCRIIHTEHCSKESCKMCHPKLDGGASSVKITEIANMAILLYGTSYDFFMSNESDEAKSKKSVKARKKASKSLESLFDSRDTPSFDDDTPSTTPATTPGTTPSTTPAKWKS